MTGAFLYSAGFPRVLAQAPVYRYERCNRNEIVWRRIPGKSVLQPENRLTHLIALYDCINEGIYGKTAIKLHVVKNMDLIFCPGDSPGFVYHSDSTIVETNTMYPGDRYTTTSHRETLKVNGWDFCPVDIMDEDGFVNLPVRGGKHLKRSCHRKSYYTI